VPKHAGKELSVREPRQIAGPDEYNAYLIPDYKSYADTGLTDIFTKEELLGTKKLSANWLEMSLFLSNGQHKWQPAPLPTKVQYVPVHAISTLDHNHNGKPDILLAGIRTRPGGALAKPMLITGCCCKGTAMRNLLMFRKRSQVFSLEAICGVFSR
jgi:hypothetical protein